MAVASRSWLTVSLGIPFTVHRQERILKQKENHRPGTRKRAGRGSPLELRLQLPLAVECQLELELGASCSLGEAEADWPETFAGGAYRPIDGAFSARSFDPSTPHTH
jgi:hypothetical protein